MPRAQCSSKLRAPSPSSRALCRKLWISTGLKTLSSKLPDAPAKLIAASLPKTCTHSIVIASHWVGFTLPGMIELPGSFSGMRISPSPERGPEASQRTSLAIFISDAASVFNVPWACTIASCAASASNLFGAEKKGNDVRAESSAATFVPNAGGALSPVPTAVPPSASSHRCGNAARTCAMP